MRCNPIPQETISSLSEKVIFSRTQNKLVIGIICVDAPFQMQYTFIYLRTVVTLWGLVTTLGLDPRGFLTSVLWFSQTPCPFLQPKSVLMDRMAFLVESEYGIVPLTLYIRKSSLRNERTWASIGRVLTLRQLKPR